MSKQPCILFISMLDQTDQHNWYVYKPKIFQPGESEQSTTFKEMSEYSNTKLDGFIKNDNMIIVDSEKEENTTEIRHIGYYWNMAAFILDIDPSRNGLGKRIDTAIDHLLVHTKTKIITDQGKEAEIDIVKYFWLVIPTSEITDLASKNISDFEFIPSPKYMAGAAGGINMRP